MPEGAVAKILHGLLLAAIVGLVALSLDTRDQVSKRVTRAEAIELIDAYTPYVRDRSLIESRLQRVEAQEPKLVEALANNTAAIQELRLQIERILVVSPVEVVRRIEEFEAQMVEALRGQ